MLYDMKYSIVMPCYLKDESHKSVVEQTIRSVKENSDDFELIIVDDGSTLPTGFLKNEADTYIRHNPTNKGIAPSWNDGKNIARGKYIAIINDDIMVPKGWLDEMSRCFKKADLCGVSGVQLAGPYEIPEILNGGMIKHHKWFSGYCFMIDSFISNVFNFDERFVPFNFEDIDMWEQIQEQGMELWKAPVKIWHAEGDTIHSMGYEDTDNENLQKFIDKWGFNPKEKYFG